MLLARMAEAVYWAGRYLERAEDMARVVKVHGDAHVDLPVGEDVGWGPLLAIAGVEQQFLDRYGIFGTGSPTSGGGSQVVEDQVVEFVLHDRDNLASVLASVSAARDNFRTARPVVPGEVWESCNDLFLDLTEHRHEVATRDGRVRWLRRVISGCQHLNGALWGTMRRDDAMAFVRIGQGLERADLTGRVLAVRAETVVPFAGGDTYDEVRWMATLRSLAAYQPFRRAMPLRHDDGSTLRFLLQDDRFPRAVAACLEEVLDLVTHLPNNGEVVDALSGAALVVADPSVAGLTPERLRALVGRLQLGLAAVHDSLETTYFRPARPAPAPRPEPVEPRILVSGSTLDLRASGRIEAMAHGRIYQVRHRTSYEYDPPVAQSINSAHLRPRNTDRQQCLSHVLEINPTPASATEYLDVFGNYVSTFQVSGRHDRLSVISTSEIQVIPAGSPPAGPAWPTVRSLLEMDRQLAARDARRYRSASRLVPTGGALEDYARESFRPGACLPEALLDLIGRIYRDFAYDPGFTSVTTPLLEVFSARRGVCQDFAHLVIGCVRSMGFAARYVSGYIETLPPAGKPRLVGADASHAWVSVYLPGWGWFDLDPTNDQVVSESHVTTAWGRDYWDVSPLRGTVEGGGQTQRLDVAVDVVRLVEATV